MKLTLKTANSINGRSLKPLAFTFALSGVWDTIAGVLYIFFIGTGWMIDNPQQTLFMQSSSDHSFYVLLFCSLCRH